MERARSVVMALRHPLAARAAQVRHHLFQDQALRTLAVAVGARLLVEVRSEALAARAVAVMAAATQGLRQPSQERLIQAVVVAAGQIHPMAALAVLE